MASVTHSAKTLETLTLMGLTTKGWRYPDIEWREVEMEVPTVITCPTCKGYGVVSDKSSQHSLKEERCPKCPPSRAYHSRNRGIGEITVMKLRKVQVGFIKWPKGTKFYASRFSHGSGDQCQLCGKTGIRNWVPVLNDKVSPPVAMYVGEDCGRTILGVAAMKDTTFEIDAANATKHSASMKAWREIPKPPKVKKPEKPKLDHSVFPTASALDAYMSAAFGPVFERSSRSIDTTRNSWRYWFLLDVGDVPREHNWWPRQSFEIKVTLLKGNISLKIEVQADVKPFIKTTGTDVMAALKEALPKIKTYMRITQ